MADPVHQPAAQPVISVELVIQQFAPVQPGHQGQGAARQSARYELFRSVHRVPAGTTIRQLLRMGCPDTTMPADPLIADIDTKARGLSRHGRRAWLDDVLVDADRVEVMLPILADARKARFERVAKNRARKWRMS